MDDLHAITNIDRRLCLELMGLIVILVRKHVGLQVIIIVIITIVIVYAVTYDGSRGGSEGRQAWKWKYN